MKNIFSAYFIKLIGKLFIAVSIVLFILSIYLTYDFFNIYFVGLNTDLVTFLMPLLSVFIMWAALQIGICMVLFGMGCLLVRVKDKNEEKMFIGKWEEKVRVHNIKKWRDKEEDVPR
jgi:hypothetical protein